MWNIIYHWLQMVNTEKKHTMEPASSRRTLLLVCENTRLAKLLYHDDLSLSRVSNLRELTRNFDLSLKLGDLQLLSGGWYVTHVGLIRIAKRNRCLGIHVQPVREFCDSSKCRWIF